MTGGGVHCVETRAEAEVGHSPHHESVQGESCASWNLVVRVASNLPSPSAVSAYLLLSLTRCCGERHLDTCRGGRSRGGDWSELEERGAKRSTAGPSRDPGGAAKAGNLGRDESTSPKGARVAGREPQ